MQSIAQNGLTDSMAGDDRTESKKQPVPELNKRVNRPLTDVPRVVLFLSQASCVVPDESHLVEAAPRHGNATEKDPQPD